MYLTQAALHKHHKPKCEHQHCDNTQHRSGANRARTPLGKKLAKGGRELGDDTHENDQRNTIANATRGDLLAQPHQEHRTTNQCDHTCGNKEYARI